MGDKLKPINQYGVQGFIATSVSLVTKTFPRTHKDIPFLNGGLFENLDKNVQVKQTKSYRLLFNRYQRNPCRFRLLIFDGAEHADLNRAYGDSTHGNTKYVV